MRSRLHRSNLCFASFALLTVPLVLTSSFATAAKAAKKHSKPAASEKASSPEPAAKEMTPPAPYETPSPAPSPEATAISTAAATPSSVSLATDSATPSATSSVTSTEVAAEAAKPDKPEEPRPLAEPPAPPPAPEEPIPATVATGGEKPVIETPAPYVEHLGPKSFPGRLRGLYGGSLWLEPSFNGLQWPFMARTGVGVSGVFWTDTGYETIIRDDRDSKMPNTKMAFQQGRAVLRLTPAYVHGRFFIQGQAELVANQCQSASDVCANNATFTTDDLWIRVGEWNRWDIKVGRFEGWEVYHLGMGMDMYTFERMGAQQFGLANPQPQLEAPAFYGVNYMHDRPTDGLALGYAAFHGYFTEAVRLEVLGELGSDNYRTDDSNKTAYTYLGARPTLIYDLGWFKLKAGAEYQQRTAVVQLVPDGGTKTDSSYYRTRMGGGASLQFVLDPRIEFGVNAAYGKQHETDDNGNAIPTSCWTTTSVGGFANLRLADLWLAGAGVNWTAQTSENRVNDSSTADYVAHLQAFAALQYLLAGQLFIKAVVGFARADFVPSDLGVASWSNYMYSARIRLMYLY